MRRRRDRGSAVAEFVMVSALVVVLGMGVFQLGLVVHVRNTLIAAAAEGARFGARADAAPGEGGRPHPRLHLRRPPRRVCR